MRVFVAFFGITRSLRHTAQSIARNVIRPIVDAGLDLRGIGHFHRPDVIVNGRSGEIGLTPDPDEATLLGLDRCIVEEQDIGLISDAYEFCRQYPDPYQDGYVSVRNLCFQLRSLGSVWNLLAPLLDKRDWVLFLRPDLHYLDSIDARALIREMEAAGLHMAVPRWHHWGGLNDRIALCGARAARLYATRGDLLRRAVPELGGLHAERLLAYAVRHADLNVGTFGYRAVRIRANGLPAPQDLRAFALA